MKETTQKRPIPLKLEVEEIEHRTRPGCDSSSTSPLCTCPIREVLAE